MPGHFIVNVPYADGEVWLDPFHQGRELSSQDLTELVQASNAQAEAEPNEERLKKVPPKDILARLLSYLKLVYLRAEAWDHAQAAIERLRLLHPENPDYLRDMGYIHDKKGSLRLAVRLYEAYLSRSPNAVDSEAVRHNLEEAAARLARLN
jgi:regulator of sirC expression with transglutaminase-like and TPR domain